LLAVEFGRSIHIDEVFQQIHIRKDVGEFVNERCRRTHVSFFLIFFFILFKLLCYWKLSLFKYQEKFQRIYCQARSKGASSVGELETSPLDPVLEEKVLGLGVGSKLLVERPRDDYMGLETLLMIIKVEIVVSRKKGKHQVVIHMIHKRLSNWDNDFHKVRRRFAKWGRKMSGWVINFSNNFSNFNQLSCISYHLTHAISLNKTNNKTTTKSNKMINRSNNRKTSNNQTLHIMIITRLH